jgi:transcriptional regulator with XRE-family HTH domain
MDRMTAFDDLGPVLRALRLEHGLTQVELSVRAGVSKSMLSLYEQGRQRPHLDTLARLLEALGVRLGELAMLLERWKDGEEAASAMDPSTARGAPSGRAEEEQVAAAIEVLQGIAALLRSALQAVPGVSPPAQESGPKDARL